MATNIDFVLDHFNSSMTLSASAEILQTDPISLDVSAIGVFEVDVAAFRKVFQYWTDASDVTDASADDVKYYVKTSHWPANLVLNPAHAMMEHSLSSNAIATGFEADRALVKHDYIRYLAHKLFNTYLGVDLFTNEEAMKDNIRDVGAVQAWGKDPSSNAALVDAPATSIWSTLLAAETGEGSGFYTNATTDKTNVTRVLLAQLSSFAHGRERLQTQTSSTDGLYEFPFVAGDTIAMKLTINAATDQHNLTGLASAIEPRTYNIKLSLVASPSNTTPTD